MDYAIVTNLLLFLGALGATFALDGGGGGDDDEDAPDEAAAPARMAASLDTGASGDDSLAADRDNLAWFLEEETPAADEEAPEEAPEVAPEEAGNGSPAAATDASDEAQSPITEGTEPAAPAFATDAADDAAPLPRLELVYAPALDPATGAPLVPVVTVAPTEDGTGSVVFLDGEPVTTFDDHAGLTPADILLLAEEPAPDAAAAEDVPPMAATQDAAKNDAATDDAQTDLTLPDPEEDPDALALIEGYVAGADRIEIGYQPATDPSGAALPPEITVLHAAPSPWATVLLDGHPVARVTGPDAPHLTAADILPWAV